MKNCKICGEPTIKDGRTEHYGCRCVRIANKNLGNTCKTRLEKACKTLDKKPELLLKKF
jgi:hypothetical protein